MVMRKEAVLVLVVNMLNTIKHYNARIEAACNLMSRTNLDFSLEGQLVQRSMRDLLPNLVNRRKDLMLAKGDLLEYVYELFDDIKNNPHVCDLDGIEIAGGETHNLNFSPERIG